MHQWIKDRPRYGWFEKSMDDTKRYNNFVGMDYEMFEEMMDRLTPMNQKQDTNMRRAPMCHWDMDSK